MRRPISKVRQSHQRQRFIAHELVYAEHLTLHAIALRQFADNVDAMRDASGRVYRNLERLGS